MSWMTRPLGWSKRARAALLIALATLLLPLGVVMAELYWDLTTHRHARPASGWYHGFFRADFHPSSPDFRTVDFLRVDATNHVRWYWLYPETFVYPELRLQWSGDTSSGTATIESASMTYRTASSTGALTSEVLRSWLLGDLSPDALPSDEMEAIFGHVRDIAEGKAPPPGHHGRTLDGPVENRMYHFMHGRGVSLYVFLWLGAWPFLTAWLARRWRILG